jgi:hypothetical protein
MLNNSNCLDISYNVPGLTEAGLVVLITQEVQLFRNEGSTQDKEAGLGEGALRRLSR